MQGYFSKMASKDSLGKSFATDMAHISFSLRKMARERHLAGGKAASDYDCPGLQSLIELFRRRPREGDIFTSLVKCSRNPRILASFVFLAFFRFAVFLAFLCVFALFSKDFTGSAERKSSFFSGDPRFFAKKARIGGSGVLQKP